ncbi:MAG: D-tyrosyl-tRNA(Tyr) deacylase [Bacilli bacterium]|nr:D-tyrosyl-tRNA(Tyr) deacylase [Bacilli bacterium]
MRVLVQRSNNASVVIDNKIYNKIDNGLVLLVGFTEGDDIEKIKYLARKIVNLRIFPDENDIMNKSILDYGGEVLSISQFTLYADTSKGNRPSYIKALGGEEANKLYELFNKELEKYVKVKTGVFGADMEINISNIGPTTISLER